MALPTVVDRQAEFDAAVFERIARLADDDFMAVDQHGRDHAESIELADMDELREHRRRQLAGGAEETVVAGPGRERAEVALQRLAVTRLDKAHGDESAAAGTQHVGILPEIVETHRRHGTLRPAREKNCRRPSKEATPPWLHFMPARTAFRTRRSS